MRPPQLKFADPGLSALRSASRAAIVMPAVFAVAYEVIRQPQTAIFAAFGSFAMLVLVDFSGPPMSRFNAYLALALTGAVLVVLGTLCARNAWLAAGAMALVGFAILFSGAINGYFAAGATAAILAFVLAVSIPVPLSALPWRLAGWGLAAGAGICALIVLWPPRRNGELRGEIAAACLALADIAGSLLSPDREAIDTRPATAGQAVDAVRKRFQSAPHRPTGPTRQAAALGALIDELGWLLGSLRTVAAAPAAGGLCAEENAEAMAATAAVLRSSAAALAWRGDQPDIARLERAQQAVARALVQQISLLPPAPDDHALESLFARSFRIRAICYAARQIARNALVASGETPGPADGTPAAADGTPAAPDSTPAGPDAAARPAVASHLTVAAQRLAPLPAALLAVRQFASEHVNSRSVWFRNSIRGAAGLAVAVFIAQRSGLQHSFWVVLGTLSVLRSNALGTGRSVLGALAGTAAGIVVGAAILLGVGASDPVLWGVLPVAVLVAAYTPRVISFAVGQAAFTVVILVLFNIIAPIGWKVGLIRIEDVAIGFAVSLGVGLVFWPRGAAAVVRDNIAVAYSRSADYVTVMARLLTGSGEAGNASRTEHAAAAAVHQLDDAFRQYLAEQSAKRVDSASAAALVAGADRMLRTGRSMATLLGMMTTDGAGIPLGRYGLSLDAQVQTLRAWYVTLGDSLANGTSVPPPQAPDPDNRRLLLQYVRDSIATGQAAASQRALLVLWASQHLDILMRLEAHLGDQATEASGLPTPLRSRRWQQASRARM